MVPPTRAPRRHKPIELRIPSSDASCRSTGFPKTGVQRHARILNEAALSPLRKGTRQTGGSCMRKGHINQQGPPFFFFVYLLALWQAWHSESNIIPSGETSTGSNSNVSRKRQPRHCHSCRHERVHQRGSEQRTRDQILSYPSFLK